MTYKGLGMLYIYSLQLYLDVKLLEILGRIIIFCVHWRHLSLWAYNEKPVHALSREKVGPR